MQKWKGKPKKPAGRMFLIVSSEPIKEFTPLSLSEMNGREGRPAFVAYQGKVYNISSSKLWTGGLHMRIHLAGQDLSASLPNAPHGQETLERFPVVGTLIVAPPQTSTVKPPQGVPPFITELLGRYPFFRRHPHPMVVHFPIVFYLSNIFFNLLYLATDEISFERTAVYCLIGAILFMPVAMLTGFLTWWLNYLARPMRPVTLKIILSCILLAVSIVLLTWRIDVPTVLMKFSPSTALYLLFILLQAPLVSAIGWYGATLTFPLEKD
jgi:predicted heme/steroid binding protein/uncharacterized membrane protein